MEIKHLKVFLSVCETGGFSKAAKILGMAQPNVTTTIKQLETELDVPLFNRIGKQISLTSQGELLLPYAKKICDCTNEIPNLFAGTGKLVIGISESIATYLFGNILREYLALHSEQEVYLQMIDGKNYMEMLRDGSLDAAFVFDTALHNKDLFLHFKKKENVFLLSSTTHELAGKHTITAKDFQTYPFLLNSHNCPYRRMFDEELKAMGVTPKIALETDSMQMLKESSLCGMGLVLLPEFAVKKELVYHLMEKINYRTNYPVYIQLLTHRQKTISPNLEAFLEIAIRHLQ